MTHEVEDLEKKVDQIIGQSRVIASAVSSLTLKAMQQGVPLGVVLLGVGAAFRSLCEVAKVDPMEIVKMKGGDLR